MNAAFDNHEDEFFDFDGEEIVESCFKAVLAKHKNTDWLMPPAFRHMVENALGALFQWPSNFTGNMFKYL